MMQLAIDYDRLRIALVTEMRRALALGQQQVIMLEPEVANAPRPALPYFAVKMATPAIIYGQDTHAIVVQDEPSPGNKVYAIETSGPRGLAVEFHSYASSHEESHGLMATWQAHLETWITQEHLRAAGLSLLRNGDVVDESALLNTGYEGRARLRITLGVKSLISAVTGDFIQSETATGQVQAGGTTAVVTATSEEG